MLSLFRHACLIVISGLIALLPLLLVMAGLFLAGFPAAQAREILDHVWPFAWAIAAYGVGHQEGWVQCQIAVLRKSWK